MSAVLWLQLPASLLFPDHVLAYDWEGGREGGELPHKVLHIQLHIQT